MIISTIKQFGFRLRADPEEIPFQYSSNIQMQFIKDENYNDYTVVGYYIQPGESEAKLLSINDDGTFILGPDCFKQRGTLSFSFNLINSQEEVHLGSIDFEIRYAFGDSDTILPESEEVWISVVTKVAKDAIKDDVAVVQQKAKEALQSASLANDKANEAQEYANNANQSANSASLSASSALTAKNDAIAASNSAIQAKQDAEQSANTALENANKSTEAIETVTQIKTEIENKANDFDTNYQEKLKSFNDNATSKQNAFDNSVQTANTNFDNKVTQANSDLDDKILGANNVIDEKILEATIQANEAKKQAQIATDEVAKVPNLIEGKLDKNLGSENADKVLVTDSQGNIATQNKEDIVTKVDNILKGEVNKSLNPIIDDSFKRELWNLKMYGKSTQIKTIGKNKFNIDGNINTLSNGTQGTKNSAENGVLTSNYNTSAEQLAGQLISVESGKQYTISLEVISVGSGNSAYVAIFKNGEPFYVPTIKVGKWKTTITATVDEILFAFGTNNGTGAQYTNIQVEEGTEVTEYEPYSGGQPSPSPQYPQEITSIEKFKGAPTGGNLFDFTKVKQSENMIVDYENKTITLMANTNNAGYVNNLKDLMGGYKIGEKYIMSAKTSNVEAQRIIYFLDIKSSIRFDEPFTLTEEMLNSPFSWYNNMESENQNVISNIQIELGETTTPYEPYQAQPFTYTPTNPMYSTQDGSIADYVDVEKGVEVYQLKKAVFNGTNATFIRLNDNNVYYTSLLSDAITPYDIKYEYYIWCDKLTTYKANQSIDSINNSIRYGNGGGASQLLFLKIDDTITTVQQLNTWLQSNPITIVYVVKTQTEISIQQEQLQMLRNLYTYTGVTNFLCNAPVSFAYERSLQIVINNLENALNTNALNIAVKE